MRASVKTAGLDGVLSEAAEEVLTQARSRTASRRSFLNGEAAPLAISYCAQDVVEQREKARADKATAEQEALDKRDRKKARTAAKKLQAAEELAERKRVREAAKLAKLADKAAAKEAREQAKLDKSTAMQAKGAAKRAAAEWAESSSDEEEWEAVEAASSENAAPGKITRAAARKAGQTSLLDITQAGNKRLCSNGAGWPLLAP